MIYLIKLIFFLLITNNSNANENDSKWNNI